MKLFFFFFSSLNRIRLFASRRFGFGNLWLTRKILFFGSDVSVNELCHIVYFVAFKWFHDIPVHVWYFVSIWQKRKKSISYNLLFLVLYSPDHSEISLKLCDKIVREFPRRAFPSSLKHQGSNVRNWMHVAVMMQGYHHKYQWRFQRECVVLVWNVCRFYAFVIWNCGNLKSFRTNQQSLQSESVKLVFFFFFLFILFISRENWCDVQNSAFSTWLPHQGKRPLQGQNHPKYPWILEFRVGTWVCAACLMWPQLMGSEKVPSHNFRFWCTGHKTTQFSK